MSSKVFISYRREDTKWAASAIHAEFCKALGDEHIFMDLDSIAPGSSWTTALANALDDCEVTIVLIGSQWLTCASAVTGQPRLYEENDFVRMEIAKSLERGIPVVPVIIDEAPFPTLADLPEDITELLDRQATTVLHRNYKADIKDLIAKLGLGDAAPKSVPNAVPPETLRDGLIRFLDRYRQWSFSSLRIAKWGASQSGFEFLSGYSPEQIRDELSRMEGEGLLETRLSKKGGALYRLPKG